MTTANAVSAPRQLAPNPAMKAQSAPEAASPAYAKDQAVLAPAPRKGHGVIGASAGAVAGGLLGYWAFVRAAGSLNAGVAIIAATCVGIGALALGGLGFLTGHFIKTGGR